MNALELAETYAVMLDQHGMYETATFVRSQHAEIERLARQKLADKDAYEALRAENQRLRDLMQEFIDYGYSREAASAALAPKGDV